MRLLLYVVPLVLMVFCLVEAITSRDDEVCHLGRVWWILLILFFPLAGSIAWLAADPEADAEFLRKVRERAEEQRRRAAEQKRREEGDYPSTGE